MFLRRRFGLIIKTWGLALALYSQMKDSMYLIIVLLLGTISWTHCTSPASGEDLQVVTQSVEKQKVTPEIVVDNVSSKEMVEESGLTSKKEITETKNEDVEIGSKNETSNESLLKNVSENKINEIESEEVKEVVADQSTSSVEIQEQATVEIENKNSVLEKRATEIATTSTDVDEKRVSIEQKIDSKKEKVDNSIDQSEFNHDKWNVILQANVSTSGKVNYAGIKSNIKSLDEYLDLLAANTPDGSWSANKTKAYWINVYNAFTIKLILHNYPVGSIIDLHGGKPWDKNWIKLGSKTYSLNDIEHVILRPTYNDPRIHFAVNCAAKSCPKVWNKAWTENNIETALNNLTKEFISNKAVNQISENSVNVSKIFEWYKEDFGDLIQFLNKYSATKISSNAKIAFNDYDWKLNS